ncbi:MotE family protein [Tropicimonas sp. S265A]|uniref:MotE family protein n=1 Tax=Tropicimonas sp. S265A TaxID=3415134 RepID=UPI003C7A8344
MKYFKRFILHPLFVLAFLFAGSAALRLGGGLGPVFATTAGFEAGSTTADGAQVCTGLPELELMYRTLQSDRDALDAQLETASLREAELAEADILMRESYEELQLMQAELAAERAEFEDSRQIASETARDDLDRLVSVYEAMKPKDAAGLFETMSPEFAAGFLGRMQPQIAAQVLSGVSPDFAYAVSVLIAGRNARDLRERPASE